MAFVVGKFAAVYTSTVCDARTTDDEMHVTEHDVVSIPLASAGRRSSRLFLSIRCDACGASKATTYHPARVVLVCACRVFLNVTMPTDGTETIKDEKR